MDSLNDIFVFSTDGTILPKNANDNKATHTIDIFNLNEKSLKERRCEQMKNVRMYKDAKFSNDEIFELLKDGGFWSALYFELNASIF